MKNLCSAVSSRATSVPARTMGAASFAFMYAVRFFAYCFFYLYYFGRTAYNTQRACLTAGN